MAELASIMAKVLGRRDSQKSSQDS